MSRVYTEDGRLAFIECDGCGESIRPGKEYMESDWIKKGIKTPIGKDNEQWDYCDECIH